MKRLWTIGLILAIGPLAAFGGMLAANAAAAPQSGVNQVSRIGQEGPRERHEELMNRVAQKLGVSPEQLRQAFAEARSELGFPSLGQRLPELRQRALEGEFGPRGSGPRDWDGERGPGRVGPGGFGGPGVGMRIGVMGRQMEIAASTIGITPSQLRDELRGSTLEAVARAHGVNPQAVVSALQNHAREQLNEAVANGLLTQEQADRMHERISQAIQRLMTMEIPDHPALREFFPREPRG
jgi:transposase-like protein